eukprot:3160268-Rhodomonas_salina.1
MLSASRLSPCSIPDGYAESGPRVSGIDRPIKLQHHDAHSTRASHVSWTSFRRTLRVSVLLPTVFFGRHHMRKEIAAVHFDCSVRKSEQKPEASLKMNVLGSNVRRTRKGARSRSGPLLFAASSCFLSATLSAPSLFPLSVLSLSGEPFPPPGPSLSTLALPLLPLSPPLSSMCASLRRLLLPGPFLPGLSLHSPSFHS